jgi:hypothetical protein
MDVHVLFTGICTLVNPPTGPTAVEIPLLLFDRKTTNTNEAIPPHEAFLVVSTDYDIIDYSGRRYEIATYIDKRYRIIYLDNDELAVRNTTFGKVTAKEFDPGDPCQKGDSDNLYWLPRISRLLKFTPQEQPVAPAGRMALSGGHLYAYVMNTYQWEFKETASSAAYQTQALAQILDWQFRIGDALLIDFGPGRYVAVRSKDGSPIVVALGSAPDIKGAVMGTVTHDHVTTDPHFEVYYDRVGEDHKILLPFKKEGYECQDYDPPTWMPNWLLPRGKPIVGSVNCGPDQWP